MKNFAEKILKIKLIATCVSIAKVLKRSTQLTIGFMEELKELLITRLIAIITMVI